MSNALNQAIASIKMLSADEKALAAHCLIASLDNVTDENVDDAWAALAARRLTELDSGAVSGLSWDEVKKTVTGGGGR